MSNNRVSEDHLAEEQPQYAEELIPAFSRCRNYPRSAEELKFLEQGLVKAHRETGVEMRVIVDRCLELSEYCPTDADFLNVAREIKVQRIEAEESARDKRAEWQRQYGKPQKFDIKGRLAVIQKSLGQKRWFENRELVDKLAAHFGDRWGRDTISHRELFAAKEQLGYPLTESERILRDTE